MEGEKTKLTLRMKVWLIKNNNNGSANNNNHKRQHRRSYLRIENGDDELTIKRNHTYNTFDIRCGFIPTSINSLTPDWCPTIQYSADTICLELVTYPMT